jgi:hypothetical protein
VFPEQSLQGYLHNLGQLKMETLEYQHANVEAVPDGESTQALIRKAKEKGCLKKSMGFCLRLFLGLPLIWKKSHEKGQKPPN